MAGYGYLNKAAKALSGATMKDEAQEEPRRQNRVQGYSRSIEQIRKAEYPQLQGPFPVSATFSKLSSNCEVSATVYLDHAGTTLYSTSLVDSFAKDMKANLFGNPHSQSPSSLLSTRRIESVRAQVLAFFKADPIYFDVVFVANATAAIKLVMESLRDHGHGEAADGFWYGYHADSHTSLVGVREVATAGSRCFASDSDVEDWLIGDEESSSDTQGMPECPNLGLFAYPAQSNMNGRRLPLTWPGHLRASSQPQHQNVYSLLDAASFVSTAQLDLSDWHNAPDFIALSFYKIFGFPDLGALLVRKSAALMLRKRPYFGGGTVDMVINATNHPSEAWHARKRMMIHEAVEDGTPPFHSIVALGLAMKVHRSLYGSMEQVSRHAGSLAEILYENLAAMRHGNGVRVCKIYKGLAADYADTRTQGPIIAFNVQAANGTWVPKSHIEQLGIVNNIQLRSGGVCNPGGIAHFLGMTAPELRRNYSKGLRCGNALDVIDGKPTGIIRVSLGAMSSMRDVRKFIIFMRLFIEPEYPAAMVSTSSLLSFNMTYERLKLLMGLKNPLDATLTSSIKEDEYVESMECPVAMCGASFDSELELQEHFREHQLVKLSDQHLVEHQKKVRRDLKNQRMAFHANKQPGFPSLNEQATIYAGLRKFQVFESSGGET